MRLKLSDLSILLVEDDNLLMMELADIIRSARAVPVTARSLVQGMKLGNDSYHAAVLDIRLPDGDVYPLADKLHANGVPLIFLSGKVNLAQAMERYPDAVMLTKPVLQQDLISAVISQVPNASPRGGMHASDS